MHEIKKMAYTGNYPCTKCENVQILQYTSGLVSERSQLSLADEYIAKRTQTSGRAGVILKFSRRNTKAVHLPPDLFELVLGSTSRVLRLQTASYSGWRPVSGLWAASGILGRGATENPLRTSRVQPSSVVKSSSIIRQRIMYVQ